MLPNMSIRFKRDSNDFSSFDKNTMASVAYNARQCSGTPVKIPQIEGCDLIAIASDSRW